MPSGRRTVRITEARERKNNTLSCAFAAASGDIIAMIDGDRKTDPQEIPRYVAALVSDPDFAGGLRPIGGGGIAGITEFRRFGNWSLHKLVNLLVGPKYRDNAFRRRCSITMRTPNMIASTHERDALIV